MYNNSVKIISVEAKDVYNANHLLYENPIGYSVRKRDGDINTKLFINTLDYSLDLIKLKEVYEKVYRRNDFSFRNGSHDYTQHVINVKFSYAQREYNKAGKGRFVINGYQWRDVELKDHVCIKDNKLIAIETDVPVEKSCDVAVLGKYFEFSGGMYRVIKNFETVKTKSELREDLYENGFVCDGIKYIRWKRSSGSSRVGKCLFINEVLYKRMHKWETCGLSPKNGDEIDLAAFEAYISLTSSSIIDTLELKPENFLVVDDYESVFKDTVVGVSFEDGNLVAKEQEYEITNSIFDGESLLDESCFPEKYKKYSMLLLRQRFFKSACFKTKIQQWFADNNITEISQLNGFTIAADISEIKVITTPSSIKFMKFGTLQRWLEMLEPTFGIVKHEKPTHYFDGRKVSCHYQLINTLQLSESDVNRLLEPSLDYITKVRSDPAVLRYHINYPYTEMGMTPIVSKNEIVFKLLGTNANFAKTKLYYDFRNDLVRSLIRELRQGHILIKGNYSTLLGNGYELLQQSIGTFNGESIIGKGNIHSKRFDYNKVILGSRSPHVCAGNVLLVRNVACEEIDKYFDLSNEVAYVNAIGENIQQRLNGADYDSDSLLLTDDQMFIDAASKNYDKFKVPTCFVSAKKIKRYYTNEQKADLDVKTSVNKIGEDINLSQQLNSLFWQRIHDGQTFEQNKELYGDICKLAVLSNIEIDKAKKEYEVDVEKELNLIKKKYLITKECVDKKTGEKIEKIVKPMFFKMITQENGYDLNPKHFYRYFDTPMDYLQKRLNSFNFHSMRENTDEVLPFSVIIKPCINPHPGKTYREQRNRIIDIVRNCNSMLSELYIGYDEKTKEEKEEVRNQADEIKQECVEYVNNLLINETTMFLLLNALDNKEYRKISRRIFTILFGAPNKLFFSMIKNNENAIEKLEESDDGNIVLYDLTYKKSPLGD